MMYNLRDPYYLLSAGLGSFLLPGILGILFLKYLLNFKGGFMTAWLGFTIGVFVYNIINYGCQFFTTHWITEYLWDSETTPPYLSLGMILMALMVVYLIKGGEDYDPFFKGAKNKNIFPIEGVHENQIKKKVRSKKIHKRTNKKYKKK